MLTPSFGTPSNKSLFPEYIFPNTRPLATDSEVLVRVAYAQCLSPLAEQAKAFLELKEVTKVDRASRNPVLDIEDETVGALSSRKAARDGG